MLLRVSASLRRGLAAAASTPARPPSFRRPPALPPAEKRIHKLCAEGRVERALNQALKLGGEPHAATWTHIMTRAARAGTPGAFRAADKAWVSAAEPQKRA